MRLFKVLLVLIFLGLFHRGLQAQDINMSHSVHVSFLKTFSNINEVLDDTTAYNFLVIPEYAAPDHSSRLISKSGNYLNINKYIDINLRLFLNQYGLYGGDEVWTNRLIIPLVTKAFHRYLNHKDLNLEELLASQIKLKNTYDSLNIPPSNGFRIHQAHTVHLYGVPSDAILAIFSIGDTVFFYDRQFLKKSRATRSFRSWICCGVLAAKTDDKSLRLEKLVWPNQRRVKRKFRSLESVLKNPNSCWLVPPSNYKRRRE